MHSSRSTPGPTDRLHGSPFVAPRDVPVQSRYRGTDDHLVNSRSAKPTTHLGPRNVFLASVSNQPAPRSSPILGIADLRQPSQRGDRYQDLRFPPPTTSTFRPHCTNAPKKASEQPLQEESSDSMSRSKLLDRRSSESSQHDNASKASAPSSASSAFDVSPRTSLYARSSRLASGTLPPIFANSREKSVSPAGFSEHSNSANDQAAQGCQQSAALLVSGGTVEYCGQANDDVAMPSRDDIINNRSGIPSREKRGSSQYHAASARLHTRATSPVSDPGYQGDRQSPKCRLCPDTEGAKAFAHTSYDDANHCNNSKVSAPKRTFCEVSQDDELERSFSPSSIDSDALSATGLATPFFRRQDKQDPRLRSNERSVNAQQISGHSGKDERGRQGARSSQAPSNLRHPSSSTITLLASAPQRKSCDRCFKMKTKVSEPNLRLLDERGIA